MPGVRGLHRYIVNNDAARNRVNLASLRCPSTKKRTKRRILCDFFPVVEWVLSAYDAYLVKTGQLSPYSLLYGGDLKLYSQRILDFVAALEHVGVSPIFFLESPPGTNRGHFDMQLPHLRTQHNHMLERCAVVHQVCEGTGNILQVRWQLSQDAHYEVVSALESQGTSMVHCIRGTIRDILQYQRSHSSVVGVLSTNTDFAFAAGSTLFHLALFDLGDNLGIHSARICPNPAEIVCDYVDPDTLCRSLHLLNERNLRDISILCGNQFTAHLNKTLEPCKKLGLPSSDFECVANWVSELDSEQWPCVTEQVDFDDPTYSKAIAQTFELYGLDNIPNDSNAGNEMNEDCSPFLQTYYSPLSSVVSGVYWRWPVLEPVTLGQSCFMDLTLPLRKKAYSVLGQEVVGEYGRTSSKSFTTVLVESNAENEVCVTGWSMSQRLVALFQLMTQYNEELFMTLEDEAASTASELDENFTSLLPLVVLVCASLCYMCHLSSQPGHLAPLQHRELQALLVTCLFCSASIPPHPIPERPPSRALAVAMQFSHMIQQVQLLASSLEVLDALPPPSGVFYPMAYMPHYIASVFSGALDHHSPNLKEAFHNYHWVLHKPAVSRLSEEITSNWSQPNLPRLLKLFAESLECIQTQSSYLFLSSKLPSLPPPHLQLNFLRSNREEPWENTSDITTEYDLDPCKDETASGDGELQKLPVSPKSDWGELSCLQDRLALEDFQYFSQEFEKLTEIEVRGGGGGGGGEGVEVLEDGESEGDDEVLIVDVQTAGKSAGKSSNIGLVVMEEEYDSLKESSSHSSASQSIYSERERSISLSEQEGIVDFDVSEGEEDITLLPPPSPISTSCSSTQPSRTPSPSAAPYSQKRRCGPDLPIAAHRDKLLELIGQNRVVCVEGETGCGKSTRVPQYILDHSLTLSPPQECRILVTQPRRMAAIKLAERVATERGEQVGYTVGYCVGGEHTNSSMSAITYCTTGYLLQALVHNPNMVSRYTHIILDEIHERSTDADFTLLVVRELLVSPGPAVKLVIMSATMQGSLVVNYLKDHFTSVAGPYFVGVKHYGVDTYFIDELDRIPRNSSFWDVCQLKSAMALQQLADNRPVESLKMAITAKPFVSTYAQEVCTEVVISQAHMGESILIFLPGYHEIAHYFEYLQSELCCRGIETHFRVFILHSQVPLEDQKDAFVDPPPYLVHVILATNIAESSITLPKLRIVINFGIYRRLQYDSKRHISCLVKSWCSRASCEQRAGRAGRVFVGTVVHLFTRQFYEVVLPAYDPPEILTAPIAKLVLQAKQIGRMIGHPQPSAFLSRAIEPPSLQQLEAALQDLARLGAVESRPGEEVDEEADITFLGHFGLSLPVDLELSRVVLFGVLFGCAADSVVIAAGMSLSQDVFSLPTRVLTKDDKVFQQALGRSYKSRCSLDSHSYSDAIMVRNLFKNWLVYRSVEHGKHFSSKIRLARKFSALYACRWERLMQLEAMTSEIAQKTLHHIPADTAVYRSLQALVSLYNVPSFCKQKPVSTQPISEYDPSRIEFCEDDDVVRAMLAASYPHQLLYGVRQCESLDAQEKAAAIGMLKLIAGSKVDLSRTLVMTGSKRLSSAALQHLAKIVIPNKFCQINTFNTTALLTLNHTFESNPLTSSQHQANATVTTTQSQELISSSLPPELIVLWQFGERRPQWRVGDVSVIFSRPQHPFALSWFRLTKEKEKVQLLSWRNPSGFMCEVDLFRKPLPFLGIAGHLQGFSSRSHVSASNVTVLPSPHSGRNAFIIALTFQPLTARVNALVDYVGNQILGIDINSFTLSPLPNGCYLDPIDINNMNRLREVISEVFTSHFTSNQLSKELMSEVRLLLSKLLSHGRTPHCTHMAQPQSTEVNETREKSVKWEELLTGEMACESDDSDVEEDAEDDSPDCNSDVYRYLPPFQCSILQHLPPVTENSTNEVGVLDKSAISVPPSLLDNDQVTGEEGSPSYSDSDPKANFKLSPNAPEFVPTVLNEDEASHTDSGTSTSCPSTERPVVPMDLPQPQLPTPPAAVGPLSKVLNPQYLSYISHLPLEQRLHIQEKTAALYRAMLLPLILPDRSDSSQTAPIHLPGQPRLLKQHVHQPHSSHSERGLLTEVQRQRQERRAMTSVRPVPSVHSGRSRETVRLGNLAQPRVVPTTSRVSSLFPFPVNIQQTKQVLPGIVGCNLDKMMEHLPVPPQLPVPHTAWKSPLSHSQLHSSVQGNTQFPHPYSAHLPQPYVTTTHIQGIGGIKSGSTAGLIQPPSYTLGGLPSRPVKSMSGYSSGSLPHITASKPPVLNTNMTSNVCFSRPARAPLLQSKLDIPSRAPGAPLSSKSLSSAGGHYQHRFPAQTSLTPFFTSPIDIPYSKKAAPSRPTSRTTFPPPGFPFLPNQGPPPRITLPSTDASLLLHKTAPSHPTPALPVSPPSLPCRQYQVDSSDLMDFIEAYLQYHGHWADLSTVFGKYLKRKGLPAQTPFPYNFIKMSKVRFTLCHSESDGIIIELKTTQEQRLGCSEREGRDESQGPSDSSLKETDTAEPVCGDDKRELSDIAEKTHPQLSDDVMTFNREYKCGQAAVKSVELSSLGHASDSGTQSQHSLSPMVTLAEETLTLQLQETTREDGMNSDLEVMEDGVHTTDGHVVGEDELRIEEGVNQTDRDLCESPTEVRTGSAEIGENVPEEEEAITESCGVVVSDRESLVEVGMTADNVLEEKEVNCGTVSDREPPESQVEVGTSEGGDNVPEEKEATVESCGIVSDREPPEPPIEVGTGEGVPEEKATVESCGTVSDRGPPEPPIEVGTGEGVPEEKATVESCGTVSDREPPEPPIEVGTGEGVPEEATVESCGTVSDRGPPEPPIEVGTGEGVPEEKVTVESCGTVSEEKAEESSSEIHAGPKSVTHCVEATEQSPADQAESSEVLESEGAEEGSRVTHPHVRRVCVDEMSNVTNDMSSGTSSKNSSEAVSPHKSTDDPSFIDASMSTVLGESTADASLTVMEDVTQTTSVVCHFEDRDWVEGKGAMGTSSTDTDPCDSHMTGDSIHTTQGSEDQRVNFFTACLLLVGGHSHINKLSVVYRKAHHSSQYTSLALFLSQPDIFQVRKSGTRSCIRLINRSQAQVPPLSLEPDVRRVMKEWEDYCPVTNKNLGGQVRWPEKYLLHKGSEERSSKKSDRRKSWGGRESRESTAEPSTTGGRRRRDRTPSSRKYSKRSSGRFSQVPRSPRFPKDIKSPSDPGHISHILDFYKKFFTTRTEPIPYSDLLSEYVQDSKLPSDFYLPSDLLKGDFDVYWEHSKRYIRPLDKTMQPPSDDLPQQKEESPPKTKEPTTNVCSSGEETHKFVTKRKAKSSNTRSAVPSLTRDVKSPSEPGHITHVLEYFRKYFESSPEPVLFSDLLKQYMEGHNLPSTFSIPQRVFGKEFCVYVDSSLRFICPRGKDDEGASTSAATKATSSRGKGEGTGGSVTGGGKKKLPGIVKEVTGSSSIRRKLPQATTATVQLPSDVKSPSDPGHPTHILEFYEKIFAGRQEPLPLEGFSLRYCKAFNLPRPFYIPRDLFEKDYVFFRNSNNVACVCPRSWNLDLCSQRAAPVAPVVHDTPEVTEVWGEVTIPSSGTTEGEGKGESEGALELKTPEGEGKGESEGALELKTTEGKGKGESEGALELKTPEGEGKGESEGALELKTTEGKGKGESEGALELKTTEGKGKGESEGALELKTTEEEGKGESEGALELKTTEGEGKGESEGALELKEQVERKSTHKIENEECELESREKSCERDLKESDITVENVEEVVKAVLFDGGGKERDVQYSGLEIMEEMTRNES